ATKFPARGMKSSLLYGPATAKAPVMISVTRVVFAGTVKPDTAVNPSQVECGEFQPLISALPVPNAPAVAEFAGKNPHRQVALESWLAAAAAAEDACRYSKW